MKRMEIGAWRLALGGVKMLGWRTSDRASSVCVCGGLSENVEIENEENGNRSLALGAWRRENARLEDV